MVVSWLPCLTAHLQRRLGHADAAHRHEQLRELIATRRIACARELRRASVAVRAASPDAAGDDFDDEVLGRAIHARALAQAGARRWSRRQFTLEAAASWGASDFLAVLPDSASYSGYTAIAPPMYRVSVAIYLGINLLELDQGTARRCPCDEACRPLDSAIGLDVLLGCNRAGHAFTLSRRHDFWVCTWDCLPLRAWCPCRGGAAPTRRPRRAGLQVPGSPRLRRRRPPHGARRRDQPRLPAAAPHVWHLRRVPLWRRRWMETGNQGPQGVPNSPTSCCSFGTMKRDLPAIQTAPSSRGQSSGRGVVGSGRVVRVWGQSGLD